MFVEGDVTRLAELQVDGPFDLILDIGCFHGLPVRRREAYVRQVARVARRGARMMIFALRAAPAVARLCQRTREPEIRRRFGEVFEIELVVPGRDPQGRPGSSSDGVESVRPA